MPESSDTKQRRWLQRFGIGEVDAQLLPQFSLGGIFYFIAALLIIIDAMLRGGGVSAAEAPYSVPELLLNLLFFAALVFIGRLMAQHRLGRQWEAQQILKDFFRVSLLIGGVFSVLGMPLDSLLQHFFLARMLIGYPLVAIGILLWLRLFVSLLDLGSLGQRRWSLGLMIGFALYLTMQWIARAFALEVLDVPLKILQGALILLTIVAFWRLPWLPLLSQKTRVHLVWKLLLVILALSLAQSVLDDTIGTILEHYLPGGTKVFSLLSVLAILWASRIWLGVLFLLPAGRLLDRRAREVETLTSLTKMLSREFNIRKVAELVTRAIPEISAANAAWITLKDQPDELLSYGLLPEHIQPFLESTALQQRLREAQDFLYVQNLAAETGLETLYLQVGTYCRSLLIMPLKTAENRLLGHLWTISRDPYAFRPYDIRLLWSFSESIGIAFERAQLFEEAVQKQRYQQELEIARQIQMSLLPGTLPEIAGLRLAAYVSPALEVGGDYYDAVQLRDGRWCILIGDVSGKGVSAALYMAELKGSVMALAHESQSPLELLAKINRVLGPTFQQKMFITLLAVAIDPAAHKLSVARAGHPPLLLFHRGELVRVQPRGIGIGIVPPEKFETLMEEQQVSVAPGTAFLLYTDGAFELQNASGEDFGLHSLEQIFVQTVRAEKQQRADFVVGGILRALSTFSEGQSQFDDITLLVGMFEASAPAWEQESRTKEIEADGIRSL